MLNLLTQIRSANHCHVITAINSPKDYDIWQQLPRDLQEFYQYCNGVILFDGGDYVYRIFGIDEIIPTNLSIIGELYKNHLSCFWHNIAIDNNGDLLSIDLSQENFGYCYDSHHETYGLVGDMPIIAKSFTQLLKRLYENQDNYPYWLLSDFQKEFFNQSDNAIR